MQKPNPREGKKLLQKIIRKAKSISKGLQKSDAGFWVYSAFSLPVHHIWWLRPINEILLRLQLQRVERQLGTNTLIVWVACPAACDVALKMEKTKLVYQRTDRFEEYPNVDANTIKAYDRKLKTTADLTIFVSKALFDAESVQCKKAIYLDHGVDFDFFSSAENNKNIPDEMRGIRRPIVGFFGGIDDHTSDIDFIEKVVDLLPEMSFVFIGKASSDCSRLMSKKNVWMLGQKPYEQIPYYGKCFNVAIMPWRQNRWIEACNPIKLKEYLAIGKPVVSTPFPELQKYQDVVYQAKTPREFAEYIKKAIVEDSPGRVATRREKVRPDSWESKADLIMNELIEAV
jgi:glycosyltransferase involved in cell wall biosynthesis